MRSGDGCCGCLYGSIIHLERRTEGKKRKKVDSGAAGDGIGAGRGAEAGGRGRRRAIPGREGGGTAAAVRVTGAGGEGKGKLCNITQRVILLCVEMCIYKGL